mgnify:CR=1 FL=1
MELKDKIQKQLLKVKSPSRYIGGEFNSVVKDKSKVDVRIAFCFPDAYDVGMSHICLWTICRYNDPLSLIHI